MEQSSSTLSRLFPHDSYQKYLALVLLVGGISSASTYAVIRLTTSLMGGKQHEEEPQQTSQLHESTQRIKDQLQGFKGIMGVFDFEVDIDTKCFREQTKGYYDTVGLPNIGNTCYMNSLMQCLAGSQKYMEYVKKLWNTIQLDDEDKGSLITFRALELLLELNRGSREASPYELYNVLCDSDFTQQSEQQDSHELLIYLQDKITKVTADHLRRHCTDLGLISLSETASGDHKNEELKVSNLSTSETNFTKQISGHLKIEDIHLSKSIGKNPFAGLQLSTITCAKCGKGDQLQRWELTYDFNVEVSMNLLDSLNRLFQPEYIDDYSCTKCSLREFLKSFPRDSSQIGDLQMREAVSFLQKLYRIHDMDDEQFVKEWTAFKKRTGNTCRLQIDKLNTRITKQIHIVNAPKILCVHLKRIYYDNMGHLCYNSIFCRFPEVLDLQQIPNMRSSEYQIDAKYRLTGVIEHFGSAYGGHYVGYRPLFPEDENFNKWVVCDDSRISIITKEQVLQRKAYMLMYQRIQ